MQGNQSGADLVRALTRLYRLAGQGQQAGNVQPQVDVILLVRGGGSMEDLWAFNDEQLANCIVQSPVPVVCGVGHETDFTIADFCSDLRAPTPTAAAELVCQPREVWLGALDLLQGKLSDAAARHLDSQAQRLDFASSRLGRPSVGMARAQARLGQQAQRARYAMQTQLRQCRSDWQDLQTRLPAAVGASLQGEQRRLDQLALRLRLLDPSLVLQRGYAWLHDCDGQTISSVRQTHPGQMLQASLADGQVDLTVSHPD